MKRILFLFTILIYSLSIYSQPMSVNVSGNVNFNNLQYSINEAGEDFSSAIENETSLYISVEYTSFWDKWFNPNKKWRINVHKTDINWNSDIAIETKRAGSGNLPWYRNGAVKINGGSNYQTITNTPSYFFNGKDEILNIPLNIRISGISLTMGAQDFETNIVLTVYDD